MARQNHHAARSLACVSTDMRPMISEAHSHSNNLTLVQPNQSSHAADRMNWFTKQIINAEATIKQAITTATKTFADEFNPGEQISPELREFVQSLCEHPDTFLKFPLDPTSSILFLLFGVLLHP